MYEEHPRKTTRRLLRVFIEEPRPLDESDIIADFEWRMAVNYKSIAKNPEVIQCVANFLKLDKDQFSLKFDRNAGCSMCSCSPGLVARTSSWIKKEFDRTDPAIWIKIS